MIDISEIFKNKQLDTEMLLLYGFSQSENRFVKDYPIMGNRYIARIFADRNGAVDFRVYDAENNEEYMPAHVFNAEGAFIGEIHKSCEDILKDISEKCCRAEHFKWQQSKRILHFIKEKYNAVPEFLWSSLPECAAIRVPGKKPWFAVIGRVPKNKFSFNESEAVEVINLKNEPKAVSAMVNEKKAFPAYHMNKQHWYTLFMDDSLSDTEIYDLIEKSYALVNS